VTRSPIQLATRSSVQPVRDEWVRPRDEQPAATTSGGIWWTGGLDGHLTVRGVYGVVICLVAAASVVAGMSPLRELAYGLGGWTYSFPWAQQIPYEIKTDLFNYLAMAVILWFAERPAGATPAQVEAAAPG
jgi:hypothetical protein